MKLSHNSDFRARLCKALAEGGPIASALLEHILPAGPVVALFELHPDRLHAVQLAPLSDFVWVVGACKLDRSVFRIERRTFVVELPDSDIAAADEEAVAAVLWRSVGRSSAYCGWPICLDRFSAVRGRLPAEVH